VTLIFTGSESKDEKRYERLKITVSIKCSVLRYTFGGVGRLCGLDGIV
jgi:hypothetical protein